MALMHPARSRLWRRRSQHRTRSMRTQRATGAGPLGRRDGCGGLVERQHRPCYRGGMSDPGDTRDVLTNADLRELAALLATGRDVPVYGSDNDLSQEQKDLMTDFPLTGLFF